MKKLLVILGLALLVPGIVMAQAPAGCTWNGDPTVRIGWSGDWGGGVDVGTIYEGQALYWDMLLQNAHILWTGTCNTTCSIPDTFCFEVTDRLGFTISCVDPGLNTPFIVTSCNYYWADVTIQTPAAPTIGAVDTIIARMVYAKGEPAATCAPECGDCADPIWRTSAGVTRPMYSADTLILTVVPIPPVLEIRQDSLTLVDRGQTQAYIPFTICNPDETADPRAYSYLITMPAGTGGRIPAISQSGTSPSVAAGGCEDVYGVIDAGTALVCDYATLTIIAWFDDPDQGLVYDTCVQIIHVVEPQEVPLFTVPVVTILVLALILAAAVFMRRREVSKA
jgi:hypothetical protein